MFEEQDRHGQLDFDAAGATAHDESPARAEASDRLIPCRRTDVLHHYVRRPCRFLELLREGSRGVEAPLGALLDRPIDLGLPAACYEHPGPHRLPDQHRRRGDSAPHTDHEESFTSRQPGPLEHPVGGARGETERAGGLPVETCRFGDRVRGGDDHFLGERAGAVLTDDGVLTAVDDVAGQALPADPARGRRVDDHLVTDGEALDPGSERRDHSCPVCAQDRREVFGRGQAPRHPQIEVIESRDAQVDSNFAGSRFGGVDVFEAECLGSGDVVQLPGFHVRQGRPGAAGSARRWQHRSSDRKDRS